MKNYDLIKTSNQPEVNFSGSTMPNWQMTSTGETIQTYTQSSSGDFTFEELYTLKLAQSKEQPNINSTQYIRTKGILYNRYYVPS